MGSNLIQATGVSIQGRGLLIMGLPGSGKSSLALSLIDRGAILIGDDGVALAPHDGVLTASPPPNIEGQMEVRNIGIIEMPCTSAPVELILQLSDDAPRYIDQADSKILAGVEVPMIKFRGGDQVQALRAEMALKIHGRRHGLPKQGDCP